MFGATKHEFRTTHRQSKRFTLVGLTDKGARYETLDTEPERTVEEYFAQR